MKILFRPAIGLTFLTSARMAAPQNPPPFNNFYQILPEKTDTPEKVLEIYRRYPWVWSEGYAFTDPADILKRLDLIWMNERRLFEKGMAKFQPGAVRMDIQPSHQQDLMQREIKELHSYWNSILTEIRDDYFGFRKGFWDVPDWRLPLNDGQIKYMKTLLAFLKEEEIDKILRQTQYAVSCLYYFMARVVYPVSFHYRRPVVAFPTAGSRAIDSPVQVVLRPRLLPASPYDDGSSSPQCDEMEAWLKLVPKLDQTILNPLNQKTGPFLMPRHKKSTLEELFRSARPEYPSQQSLPLEMTLIDPTPEQIDQVLQALLQCETFRGNRVRLIIETTQGLEAGHWRRSSVQEYRVEADPQSPSKRRAVFHGAKELIPKSS